MSEVDRLKTALTWILKERVVFRPAYTCREYTIPASFEDPGCGCCGKGAVKPPADIAETLAPFMESA